MLLWLEYSLVGVAAGGVYALIALGFVLIFNKATGVFNFAMGEMMMLGAYLFFSASQLAGLPWPVALALALLGSVVLGVLIERTVLRPMLAQPVISLVMVTVGLGSVLRGFASLVWGQDVRSLPDLFPRTPLFIGEIPIPGKPAWGFVLAIGLVTAFLVYFRFSRGAVALRATAADQINAYCMGIDVRRVYAATWSLAAMAGTISGIIIASINGLEPNLGEIVFSVLAVVILGGLDSVGGVILAGLAI